MVTLIHICFPSVVCRHSCFAVCVSGSSRLSSLQARGQTCPAGASPSVPQILESLLPHKQNVEKGPFCAAGCPGPCRGPAQSAAHRAKPGWKRARFGSFVFWWWSRGCVGSEGTQLSPLTGHRRVSHPPSSTHRCHHPQRHQGWVARAVPVPSAARMQIHPFCSASLLLGLTSASQLQHCFSIGKKNPSEHPA